MNPPSWSVLERLAPCKPVSGLPGIVAYQADDVFALWQAWEDECGRERQTPFWATVWPAAAVLAQYVLRGLVHVAGKRVLEIGCGGAIVSVAAAKMGATAVEANDTDPVALHIARLNAEANAAVICCTGSDSMRGVLPDVDIVLVADLFYERQASAVLCQRLRALATAGCEVVIADGGRPFAPRKGVEELGRECVPVNEQLEGVGERTVTVVRVVAGRPPLGVSYRTPPPER